MRTRLPDVGPRFGTLLTLALSAPVTMLLSHDASATPAVENARTSSEFAVVTTHVWQQTPGASTTPGEPIGTWIDGVHGPVLDGALLSTPMLVALLGTIAVLAVTMAARASHASRRTSTAAVTATAKGH